MLSFLVLYISVLSWQFLTDFDCSKNRKYRFCTTSEGNKSLFLFENIFFVRTVLNDPERNVAGM
jgi:hypothetical protein